MSAKEAGWKNTAERQSFIIANDLRFLRPYQKNALLALQQALVTANRELITRFEKKIQVTLARVWGEEPELEKSS